MNEQKRCRRIDIIFRPNLLQEKLPARKDRRSQKMTTTVTHPEDYITTKIFLNQLFSIQLSFYKTTGSIQAVKY